MTPRGSKSNLAGVSEDSKSAREVENLPSMAPRVFLHLTNVVHMSIDVDVRVVR